MHFSILINVIYHFSQGCPNILKVNLVHSSTYYKHKSEYKQLKKYVYVTKNCFSKKPKYK